MQTSLMVYNKMMDVLVVDDIEIKREMFVIVPYDFATTSNKKETTKNILALILNLNDKTWRCNIES